MDYKIDLQCIKRGDILLYHGKNGLISKAINFFDEAIYSHSSIYYGRVNGEEKVLHATKKGAHIANLEDSLKKYNKVIIKRLNTNPNDMYEVIKHSESLLDKQYDFSQIITIAFVMLTTKVARKNNYLAKLVTYLLNSCSRELFFARIHDDSKLTCAEYTFRSYNDCNSDDNHQFQIKLKERISDKFIEKPNGDLIELVSKEEVSSFEEDSLLENVFKDPNDTNNKTVVKMSKEDIIAFLERWNGDDPEFSPFQNASQDILDKIEQLLTDYINSTSNSASSSGNSMEIGGSSENKFSIQEFINLTNSLEMSDEERENMNRAIKDYVLMEGKLIDFEKEKGFVMPPEKRFSADEIRFDDYSYYRSKFVTAKDLNNAENLMDCGIVIDIFF